MITKQAAKAWGFRLFVFFVIPFSVSAFNLHRVSHLPVHIVLKDDVCKEIHAAMDANGKPDPHAADFPCAYSAYIFPSNAGLLTYGVSANVKDQCGLIPTDSIDDHKTKREHDAPALYDIPEACAHHYNGVKVNNPFF